MYIGSKGVIKMFLPARPTVMRAFGLSARHRRRSFAVLAKGIGVMDRGGGIRLAQAADEPAVRSCAKEAFERYVAVIGQVPAPMMADFAALIRSGYVHVAINGQGDVAGFIVFFQAGDHVLLETVAVRRNAAGRGIGKRLIALCEAAAKRSGATSVQLYTNEKMTENLSIYPHLGYRETGRATQDGFKRVFFEKRI